jgi:hypothetical protein
MQEINNNPNNNFNNQQSKYVGQPNDTINQDYRAQQYQPQNPINQIPNPNYNQSQIQFTNSKVAKIATPKKSIFSIHNVLISLLMIYAIFSFGWLAVLYALIQNKP